jgi:hypothetical protein
MNPPSANPNLWAQYGLLGLVLFTIFFALIGAGWYIIRRLFNKNDGLITIAINDHSNFLEKVTNTLSENQLTNQKIESSLKKLVTANEQLFELHQDPEAPFSTVKTNLSLQHLGVMLNRLAKHSLPEDEYSEVKEHLKEIKLIFTSANDTTVIDS